MDPKVTPEYYQNLLAMARQQEFLESALRLERGLRTFLDPILGAVPVSEVWGYLRSYGVPEEEILGLQRVPLPRAPRTRELMSVYEFGQEVGKNVVNGIPDGDAAALSPHLRTWAKALVTLPPRASSLFQSEVKKLLVTVPHGSTEDASWNPGGVLKLVLKKGETPNLGTYRSRVIHEMGHALEDHLGLILTPWTSIYGNDPYVSEYAKQNATEDFAETFRALVEEPGRLKRLTPAKMQDILARLQR